MNGIRALRSCSISWLSQFALIELQLSLVQFGIKLCVLVGIKFIQILSLSVFVSLSRLLNRWPLPQLVLDGCFNCSRFKLFVFDCHEVVVSHIQLFKGVVCLRRQLLMTLLQFAYLFFRRRRVEIIVPQIWISFEVFTLNYPLKIDLGLFLQVFTWFWLKSILFKVKRGHHLIVLLIVILFEWRLSLCKHRINCILFLEVSAQSIRLDLQVGRQLVPKQLCWPISFVLLFFWIR